MRWMASFVFVTILMGAPAYGQIAAASDPPPPTGQTPESTNTAPPHAHTGWSTLLRDTAQDFVAFPKRRSTWTLLGIGAAAALAARTQDRYVKSHIVGNEGADRFFSAGKFAGNTYLHLGSAAGLWAIGRYVVAPVAEQPQTNRLSEIGFDLVRAQLLTHGIVHGMKRSFQRDRPTGDCCALPSGHAAAAFAAASVLERHIGYRGSWPALAAATYVATSRLVDNRHFLSDVVMGAAVGTASGWTVVGRRGRSQFSLQPVPVQGGMMITLARTTEP